jgi:hypothetical protein
MDRLTAMETFVHVVETGSFSAAAKRLGIGQPAVSKSIAQLEARLAVRLVMRSTRGLTPTEAGLAFSRRPSAPSNRPTTPTMPHAVPVPGCRATCGSVRR